jgi:hypothetical protein
MSASFFDRYKLNFKRGDLVFRDGEIGTEMYILRSGRVELVKQVGSEEHVIADLDKGDFFGEMAVLENLPRTATARVVEDAELICVNGSTFDQMIRSNMEIAVRMLRKFSSRLRAANREIEDLLKRTPAASAAAAQPDPQAVPARPPAVTAPSPQAAPPAEAAPSPQLAPTPVAAPTPAKPLAPPEPAPVAQPPAAAPVVEDEPLSPVEPAAAAATEPQTAATPQPEPAAPAAPPVLAVMTVKGSDRRFLITKHEISVGRADPVTGLQPEVDLSQDDINRFISRRHARIVRQGDTFFLVEEAGVTNGTYLNGKRLQGGVLTPIQFGDELCFGKVFVLFDAPPE